MQKKADEESAFEDKIAREKDAVSKAAAVKATAKNVLADTAPDRARERAVVREAAAREQREGEYTKNALADQLARETAAAKEDVATKKAAADKAAEQARGIAAVKKVKATLEEVVAAREQWEADYAHKAFVDKLTREKVAEQQAAAKRAPADKGRAPELAPRPADQARERTGGEEQRERQFAKKAQMAFEDRVRREKAAAEKAAIEKGAKKEAWAAKAPAVKARLEEVEVRKAADDANMAAADKISIQAETNKAAAGMERAARVKAAAEKAIADMLEMEKATVCKEQGREGLKKGLEGLKFIEQERLKQQAHGVRPRASENYWRNAELQQQLQEDRHEDLKRSVERLKLAEQDRLKQEARRVTQRASEHYRRDWEVGSFVEGGEGPAHASASKAVQGAGPPALPLKPEQRIPQSQKPTYVAAAIDVEFAIVAPPSSPGLVIAKSWSSREAKLYSPCLLPQAVQRDMPPPTFAWVGGGSKQLGGYYAALDERQRVENEQRLVRGNGPTLVASSRERIGVGRVTSGRN